MKLLKSKISISELSKIAENTFYDMVKVVVDIKLGIMVIDAEMHSDQEAYLLEQGSLQEDIWGINLYPAQRANEFIEFDSMINIRPHQNNRSRDVEDELIRKKIVEIVSKLIND